MLGCLYRLSVAVSHVRAFFFFFKDTATTEIYTLSLHAALPIYRRHRRRRVALDGQHPPGDVLGRLRRLLRQLLHLVGHRSEEHTSELQSRQYLVCRLLLEKKKKSYNKFLDTCRKQQSATYYDTK